MPDQSPVGERKNQQPIAQRVDSSIPTKSAWLWFGYSSTPGLEHYRSEERYAAWLFVHRQLQKSNGNYLAACRLFYAHLIVCIFFGVSILTLTRPSTHLAVALGLAVTGMCGAILWVFAREQRRRNAAIAKRLAANRCG